MDPKNGTNIQDNLWHHCCVTADPSNGWAFYVDGIVFATQTVVQTPYVVGRVYSSNFIGKNNTASTSILPIFNDIDVSQLRIYNRALSPTEVAYIGYNKPIVAYDLQYPILYFNNYIGPIQRFFYWTYYVLPFLD